MIRDRTNGRDLVDVVNGQSATQLIDDRNVVVGLLIIDVVNDVLRKFPRGDLGINELLRGHRLAQSGVIRAVVGRAGVDGETFRGVIQSREVALDRVTRNVDVGDDVSPLLVAGRGVSVCRGKHVDRRSLSQPREAGH